MGARFDKGLVQRTTPGLIISLTLGLAAATLAQSRFVPPPPGLIYTSSDSGTTWSPHETSRQWTAVASSADGRKLVAADYGLRDRRDGGSHDSSGGRIYTSEDSGATWTPQWTNKFWNCIASSAEGSRLVAGTFGDCLYTSADSGVTWTPHEASLNWASVASSADGGKLVALAFGHQVCTSSDFGATWTRHDTNRLWVAVASSADGSKLVAAVQNDGLFTSTDSGQTWTRRESFSDCHAVASSVDGSKLVAVGFSGQVITSTDSGTNWTRRPAQTSGFAVASSADGSTLATSEVVGRILISLDSGASWKPCGTNGNWTAFAFSSDGTKIAAAAAGSESLMAESSDRPDSATLKSTDELLIPASLNTVLFNIQPDMSTNQVLAVLSRSYPKVSGHLGEWSGQTGYFDYRLDERFTLSVSSVMRDGKEMVHHNLLFYIFDWQRKRRIDIRPHHWDGVNKTTNSFGIYLTAEPVDRRITAYGKGDWSHIRLLESPLISAADIISYNLADHSMRLKPEALARIPRPPVEGIPFVVAVDGQRIYLGAFTTCSSSTSFAVPSIMVDRRVVVTNQPTDTLVIDRAYPSPSFGVGPDPRGDERIRNALAALQKLGGDYHLIQSQIADEVPLHGPVESATAYVLVCPDQRLYVFRALHSHPMEEIIKHFPRGSVLHYDANALIKPPPQAQIQALAAFGRSNGISVVITPTN